MKGLRPTGLLLLALVLNGLYYWQYATRSPFATSPIGDSYLYDALARTLSSNGFRSDGVFHQAPLYPYSLALAYRITAANPHVASIVQVLFASLIPWLLHRLGTRHAGPHAGLAAALAGAFYGPLWAFAPRLLPTVPVIVLQLLFLERIPKPGDRGWSAWIVPGILLGLLCAARPNHLLLVPLILTAALARRLQPRAAATLLGVTTLVIAPITLHNARADGSFLLVSSNAGETFAHGNNENARGTYSLVAGLRSGNILRQAEISREIAEAERGRSLKASEVQGYWFSRGVSFIRENPARFFALELQKLRLMLGAEEAPDIYSPSLESRRFTPFLRIGFVSSLWILPFALTGLWIGRRRWPGWFWALLLTEALTLLVFYVSNRYRLSWEVLLLLPAGLAIASLRERRTWFVLVPSLMIALLLSTTSSTARRTEAWGMTLANLGTSLARTERYADAEDAFRAAIEVDPGWARSHHYLGRVLAFQGRTDAAVDAFERALALEPTLVEARVDLAAAELTRGNVPAARDAWMGLPAGTSLPPEIVRPALRIGNDLVRASLDRADCAGARDAWRRCREMAGSSIDLSALAAVIESRCAENDSTASR
jgi:tetratricopeptide (TPR) repeat protein